MIRSSGRSSPHRRLPQRCWQTISRATSAPSLTPPRRRSTSRARSSTTRGGRSQCDALFRARLATGEPLHIYVLVEHKSQVDGTTPLQLLGYTVHDLGRIAPERLSRDPEVRSALVTLAVATATDMGPEDLDRIGAALVADGVMERVVLRYIAEVANLMPAAMEASLRRTQPERWEMLMGTMAETWIEEGRTEGKAALLLRLMERRFGDVPEAVRARVTGASTDELDAWGEALIEAATLEDVMASGSRH